MVDTRQDDATTGTEPTAPAVPDRGEPVRWGFLGTGSIAATLASDLALTPGGQRFAVASRSGERAAQFAAEHGFERHHEGYDALLADPDVDVVYVATPHAQHHAVVSRALAAGKPVLVEKSFTVTAAAARDLAERADAAGVFCMEAMWTRFQPAVVELRRLVTAGEIGEVRSVQADFGFASEVDPAHRLWDPAQGGGALLDLGVYPVSFAQMLLGSPTSVAVHGSLASTGVDAEAALLLGWRGGASALLSCSLTGRSSGTARVVGTLGRVDVAAPFHRTPQLTVTRATGQHEEGEVRVVPATSLGRGYVHQLQEVHRCLAAGLRESPVMSLADTVAVMQVLDAALTDLGAVHADEGFGG